MCKGSECYILILLVIISTAGAELYTALVDLEPLLVTHKRIIDDLEDYIVKEEKRVEFLKQKLLIYKREHEKAMEDIPNYLGNPLNSFTLIKRLTTDLDNIEDSIKIGTEFIKNITMSQKDAKYPSEEDLNGAASALIRLQETYKLNPEDLSDGKLNGIQYGNPLTASDCYELGKSLYTMGDYHYSQLWMTEALKKYDHDDEPSKKFVKADIIEYISFSYYLQGNIEAALNWTRELIKLSPNHPRAVGNIPHYEKALQEKKNQEHRRQRGDVGNDNIEESVKKPASFERGRYEALCRGDFDIPPTVIKDLKCMFTSEHHPFLRLAPFKVEEIYKNPDIFLYHDVMSDDEIAFIKEMAKPRFRRATVHNPETGELVPAHYRISKSSWLKDTESEVVARISQRASDLSGFSMTTAEELQVVNYGIGGHYEPHFDFARKEETRAFQTLEGNRIATVLFYMSDVAQGGATVFTELGIGVKPKKGTALVWRNLHPSGEGDFATRHAACPVLAGSKWVCNKWIHQGGQEFIKPCDLEYQQEGIIRAIPKAIPKSSR